MTNNKTKMIYSFPNTIPSAIIRGKTYKWNDVNDRSSPIGSFGLLSNMFWGGRVHTLGHIKEFGFWACQDKNDPTKQKILGFYLPDPQKITELGKEVLEETLKELFPNIEYEIVYEMTEDLPRPNEDPVSREKVIKEAMSIGVLDKNFKHISGASTSTLKSLIAAAKYEQKLERAKEIKEKKEVLEQPVKAQDVATDLIKQAKERKVKSATVNA